METGGQGVRSDPESEGHEEKRRAVIEGEPPLMNRSAEGGRGRACNLKAKAFSFAHRSKAVADSTTRKNSDVTSGELIG